MNNNITEESTRHCKQIKLQMGLTLLPLIITEKRGDIYEDICSSAHIFLAKNTCNKQRKSKPKQSNEVS